MITELKILGSKVDLYKDENIDVINSVIDIKDISKNTNAFTRGFTVPASANNNQLFKHYYDADLDNSFDARTKISAEILLDGISFKTGFIQLTKVNIKKNKPTSYSINFSGGLNGISKAAGDKKLKDLNLTAYDHDYDSATVNTGLQSSLFSGDLIYNALTKKQLYINSVGTDGTQTDTLSNISYDGAAAAGLIWNDLKPSLKLIVLIEAIETLLGITFSRHFFDTTEFQNLFMWLNPSKKKEIEGNTQIIDWTTNNAGAVWMNVDTDIGTYPCNADTNDYVSLYMRLTPTDLNIEYTLKMYVDDDVFFEATHTGIFQNGFFNQYPIWTLYGDAGAGAQTKNVYWEVVANQEFTFVAELFQSLDIESNGFYTTDAATQTIDSKFILSENMPDLKIIDFLKGLFSMYKLIVLPLPDGTYKVIELDAYYAEGTSYDVTKYIDFEEWDVNRGKIFNEISFTFQEPTTRNNIFYEQINDRGFGDEELILREDQSDITSEQLEGDSFTLKLPFEQVIFERLEDQVDGLAGNFTYGAIVDEDNEPVNPKPIIFYNYNTVSNSKGIAFLGDTPGDRTQLQRFNNPLHASELVNPLYSTTFSREQNIWDNTYLDNNLYSNHYSNYINDTFNIKKREYKYKAYLPLNIITKLELNDLLIIKGSFYRINKYSYNIITGETDLELINYFGTIAVGQVRSSQSVITKSYEAQSEKVFVYNLAGSNYKQVDVSGDGTAWISYTAADSGILTLTFTEYNSGRSNRSMYFDIINGGITTRILINQTPLTVFNSMDFSQASNSMNIALITLRA